MVATRSTAPIHQGISGQDPVFLSVKKGMTVMAAPTPMTGGWLM